MQDLVRENSEAQHSLDLVDEEWGQDPPHRLMPQALTLGETFESTLFLEIQTHLWTLGSPIE